MSQYKSCLIKNAPVCSHKLFLLKDKEDTQVLMIDRNKQNRHMVLLSLLMIYF